MRFLEIHEQELSILAARDSAKGRVFAKCLEKDLTLDDIESLIHMSGQSALSYKNVEKVLDVLGR